MSIPNYEIPQPGLSLHNETTRSSEEGRTYVGAEGSIDQEPKPLTLETSENPDDYYAAMHSPSQAREQENRLEDDLEMLRAERVVSRSQTSGNGNFVHSVSMSRSRTRHSEPLDEFDIATNPVHEKNAVYRPPELPSTKLAKFMKTIHNSSFLVRYFTYITPIVVVLLVPLLLGALLFKEATVGGVYLMWFSVWLEIIWLTLWAGRIVAKMLPWPLGLLSSLFTNNSKKWRDMGKQLEVPATIFFWTLGVEVSFLPIMTLHMVPGYGGDTTWLATVNKVIVSVLIGATLNFVEKIIIQLIAISFHLRTYADRIEINKFQIGSLVKLYQYSKEKIQMEDSDFEEGGPSGPTSGARTPKAYLEMAQKNVTHAFNRVGDVAGKVAGDFTGKQVTKSTHPHQVVLTLLNSTSGSQVLARRLYRTFALEGSETVSSGEIRPAFDNEEESEAAFTMFDKDLNGDISMEELEAVCVEIGRERKSITASLKDLDSVVSKLDGILLFFVLAVSILVFITLISTSAAGVLTSAGSTVLALSWLFSATAQEFLQSVIFVFVKHPFDVGDRVSIYGNTGANGKGDDYVVKEISLLYTEFKKMEGHLVQAPNSYLNTLFILNMRRSGGLAEAVPITVKFGTTLDQIEQLRARLLEFVKSEQREYQGNILTELRDVVEAHSININIVFFYKSNWQNELLRLQRRNKFICHLMLNMIELDIEGPRMRIPGTRADQPFYMESMADCGAPPNSTAIDPNPRSGSLSRDAVSVPNAMELPRSHPSILRTYGSTSRSTRRRGESISAMSKRVDFSLGMKDVSSSASMGDVYADEDVKSRMADINRIAASRAREAECIDEQPDAEAAASGRSTSREMGRTRSRFGLRRSSTESQSRLRSSNSGIHPNRFFGRKNRPSMESADQDLMEQGMADIPESRPMSDHLDSRTGIVSPRAIRMTTGENTRAGGFLSEEERKVGKAPMSSANRDFEMKPMGR